MQNILERFFLSEYKKAHFINQQKAKALMYYNLLMVALLIILMITYSFINPAGMMRAIIGANSIILFVFLSFIFLKRGYLTGAVMVYLIPTVLLITAARFINALRIPYGGFTSYLYYCFYLIVFTAVFGKKYMVPLISIYFLAVNIIFYFFIKGSLSGVTLEIAGTGVANSTPGLLIVGVVSYINIYLTEKSNSLHKEEADINKKQFLIISNLFTSIKDISAKLQATASSFNQTSGDIADGARNQAAILEESSASMEEMAGTIENVSKEIASQSESINEIDRIMGDLNSLINNLTERAGAIKAESDRAIILADNAVKNSAVALEGMRKIQNSSEQIKSIIELISEIADQTNLLALNAAIESARAGEAGRGFAVVSDEISKLADKSTQSAKEIGALITETGKNINTDFHLFNELDIHIRKMKETLIVSEKFSREMNESALQQLNLSSRVKDSIHGANIISGNVNLAMNEQSKTSFVLSNSLAGASEITQKNAESSAEVSDMTADLLASTERLLELIKSAENRE
jgi:methyl-accepting chemotaxis protein